jgi:hypothetical protein
MRVARCRDILPPEARAVKGFMVYISYEMLVMYLLTAAMYVAGTAAVVALLWLRGEVAGALVLAPIVVLSWAGLLGQVAHVAEASADMRRFLRRD